MLKFKTKIKYKNQKTPNKKIINEFLKNETSNQKIK